MDLARAEAVEKELDAMIRRRDDKRRETEGERRERELWAETEARHVGKRREQNRAEWAAYHRQQAERHQPTLTGYPGEYPDAPEGGPGVPWGDPGGSDT